MARNARTMPFFVAIAALFTVITTTIYSDTTFATDIGTSTNPAKSCYQIKLELPTKPDGVYWLQSGSMSTAKQYYCDMTTNGGGWQLLFQRAGGVNNLDTCSGVAKSTLNAFLHDGPCGDPATLGYGSSYNADDVDTTIAQFTPAAYMNLQYTSTMAIDTAEAHTLHTTANLFPNSPSASSVVDIPVDKVCDINNSNCDNTNVMWKYIGGSWFHSSLCIAGNHAGNSQYPGNYGYCHNGWNGALANSLFGTRSGYDETKLYKYPGYQAKDRMERMFIRPKAPEFNALTVASDNTKNTAYAKAGDKVRMTISLKEADTWKSSYNKPTFSIGSTTGLQTANYLGSSPQKLSGYRNYTILAGQNGAITVTDLAFKNRNELSILGFTAPYVPASNVIVDTTLPTITFTDDVSATLTQTDDITITVSDTNEDATSYRYGFSADATCNAADTYGSTITSGTAFTISDSNNNGSYICVKAEDAAGNVAYQASAHPLFIGQLTATPSAAPDLKDASDSGASSTDNITHDTTPTITGNCIASSEVRVYVGGAAATDSATCAADGTFEFTLPTALADGAHAISYTQNQTAAGYEESNRSPELTITVDTVSPTNLAIQLDTVAPRSIDNPEVTFSAADADSGISYYTVAADGGTATTQTSPYVATLTPAASHTIVVTAYDVAGNSVNSSVTYPPVVNISAPTVLINRNITDTSIVVTGPNPITSVAISGVTYTDLVCTPTPTAAGVSGPITCSLTITSSGTLTASAQDTTSATGTASRSYTIETDAPVISFTKDVEPGPVQMDEVSIQVTDAHPKVSSYQYGFSSDATCDTNDSYTEAFTSGAVITYTTEANNGKYICAKAEDAAGNVSYQASAHPLNIDITPPTAQMSYSPSTPTNTAVVVTMTASEPIATLAGWTKVSATVYTKTVSANEVGTASIQDIAGNSATVSYTVNNIDTTPPAATLTGDNPQVISEGSTYSDLGATCTDTDSTCTVAVAGAVDAAKVGEYTVTYTAKDAAGNTASVTRTVSVVPDLDKDGIPDATDPDIDGDGILNENETRYGIDPKDAGSRPRSTMLVEKNSPAEEAYSPIFAQSTLRVADGLCNHIQKAQAVSVAAVSAPDADTDIVAGVTFNLACADLGEKATAQFTLGQYIADVSTVRVYKKQNGTMVDVTNNVTLANTGGQTLLEIKLVDGQVYDEDGKVDARILDPLYVGIYTPPTPAAPAKQSQSLAPTGQGIGMIAAIGGGVLVAGAILVVIIVRNKKKRRS